MDNRTKLKIAQALGGKVLVTPAQKENLTILNERPDGMPFEMYKYLRRKQTKNIKNLLR